MPGSVPAGRTSSGVAPAEDSALRRSSVGVQDGLLIVAGLAVLLGVALGTSALVRWLLNW